MGRLFETHISIEFLALLALSCRVFQDDLLTYDYKVYLLLQQSNLNLVIAYFWYFSNYYKKALLKSKTYLVPTVSTRRYKDSVVALHVIKSLYTKLYDSFKR